jgi:carbonic anhydrase
MDGTEYPLEIHIIHWNMKYGSFAEAIKYSDGLAVLGFFYEVSTADNGNLAPILAKFSTVALTRSQLKRINKKKKTSKGQFRAAPDITFFCDYHAPFPNPLCSNQNADADANNAALDGTFSLNQFLPTTGAGDDYFYYSGGLTTPACNEIVLWTNFVSKNKISETQLALFRSLKDGLGAGTAIVDNYRPPQALNGRTISKRSASSTTAATSSSMSGLTIGAAIGAVVMYFVLGSGILTQLLPPTQNQRSYREYYNPVPQSLNQNYRTY